MGAAGVLPGAGAAGVLPGAGAGRYAGPEAPDEPRGLGLPMGRPVPSTGISATGTLGAGLGSSFVRGELAGGVAACPPPEGRAAGTAAPDAGDGEPCGSGAAGASTAPAFPGGVPAPPAGSLLAGPEEAGPGSIALPAPPAVEGAGCGRLSRSAGRVETEGEIGFTAFGAGSAGLDTTVTGAAGVSPAKGSSGREAGSAPAMNNIHSS